MTPEVGRKVAHVPMDSADRSKTSLLRLVHAQHHLRHCVRMALGVQQHVFFTMSCETATKAVACLLGEAVCSNH